jgi:hypothetical protein
LIAKIDLCNFPSSSPGNHRRDKHRIDYTMNCAHLSDRYRRLVDHDDCQMARTVLDGFQLRRGTSIFLDQMSHLHKVWKELHPLRCVSLLFLCTYQHPLHELRLRMVDTTFVSINTVSPFMTLEKRHSHDFLLAGCRILSLSLYLSLSFQFNLLDHFLRWMKVVVLFLIPISDHK